MVDARKSKDLSCQTPQMNEKELWVYLLAYNLIRMLRVQAAMDKASRSSFEDSF